MSRAEDLMRLLEMQGASGVDQLIDDAESEKLFLEFKSIHDESLKGSELKNLSRCLSGFANSDGGVVIWGVKTEKRGDVEIPLRGGQARDCVSLAKRLEDKVSGRTVPPVKGVRTLALPIQGGPQGYVALYVPAGTEGPYQAVDGSQYLIRVGSSFQPATHGVLSGMFGRPPQPQVSVNYVLSSARSANEGGSLCVQVGLSLALVNFGPTIATDCFLSWLVHDIGGQRCSLKTSGIDGIRWATDSIDDRVGSTIAAQGNRLAPGGMQVVLNMQFAFRPPLDGGFEMELSIGCAGAPTQKISHRVAPAEFAVFFADAGSSNGAGDRHLLSAKLLGLKAHWDRGGPGPG